MIWGIPYIVWFSILGAIGLMLYIMPSKKRSNDKLDGEKAAYEQFRKSCEDAIEDMVEMRWIRARVAPNEVPELLNRIEAAKITVMYQFFVRNNSYDMFFRCRKSQLEELKKILDLE